MRRLIVSCDFCDKEIVKDLFIGENMQYRKDFCSYDCLEKDMNNYFKVKEEGFSDDYKVTFVQEINIFL